MNKRKKFYITTLIYYVNDWPHPFDLAPDEAGAVK